MMEKQTQNCRAEEDERLKWFIANRPSSMLVPFNPLDALRVSSTRVIPRNPGSGVISSLAQTVLLLKRERERERGGLAISQLGECVSHTQL